MGTDEKVVHSMATLIPHIPIDFALNDDFKTIFNE
jgi:hypothetical protein